MRPLSLLVIRFLANVVIVSTVVAVTVGYWHIKPGEKRTLCTPAYHPIRKIHLYGDDHRPCMFDFAKDKVCRLDISKSDYVEVASCSPYRDHLGRFHLVGSWHSIVPRAEGLVSFGLARFAVPGGELLDRIEFDSNFTDPPCWAPDTSGQILFAGGNGRLYTHTFSTHMPFRQVNASSQPKKLVWKPAAPKEEHFAISHAFWPNDPRLANIIVVSAVDLTLMVELANAGRQAEIINKHAGLWWLQLNANRDAIERVGNLWKPGSNASEPADLRFPNVIINAAGELRMVFLRRELSENARLLLARGRIDDRLGIPQFDTTTVMELAQGCLMSPPGFSNDGRTVFALLGSPQGPAYLRHYAISEGLGGQLTYVARSALEEVHSVGE